MTNSHVSNQKTFHLFPCVSRRMIGAYSGSVIQGIVWIYSIHSALVTSFELHKTSINIKPASSLREFVCHSGAKSDGVVRSYRPAAIIPTWNVFECSRNGNPVSFITFVNISPTEYLVNTLKKVWWKLTLTNCQAGHFKLNTEKINE